MLWYTWYMPNETTYDFTEIDVCTDCMLWHGKGTLPGEQKSDRSFDAIVNAPGIPAGIDVEPTGTGLADCRFSEQPCDACQRPLRGMRFTALLVIALPVPNDRIGV